MFINFKQLKCSKTKIMPILLHLLEVISKKDIHVTIHALQFFFV